MLELSGVVDNKELRKMGTGKPGFHVREILRVCPKKDSDCN